MTIEAYLTRELDIRFIDARTIVNEAKVALNIQGYPNVEQALEIRREAVVIFEDQPTKVKSSMRQHKEELDEIKSLADADASSHSFATSNMDDTDHSMQSFGGCGGGHFWQISSISSTKSKKHQLSVGSFFASRRQNV